MLEQIVTLFYIPWVFWSVPMLIAVGIELYRRHSRSRPGPQSRR